MTKLPANRQPAKPAEIKLSEEIRDLHIEALATSQQVGMITKTDPSIASISHDDDVPYPFTPGRVLQRSPVSSKRQLSSPDERKTPSKRSNARPSLPLDSNSNDKMDSDILSITYEADVESSFFDCSKNQDASSSDPSDKEETEGLMTPSSTYILIARGPEATQALMNFVGSQPDLDLCELPEGTPKEEITGYLKNMFQKEAPAKKKPEEKKNTANKGTPETVKSQVRPPPPVAPSAPPASTGRTIGITHMWKGSEHQFPEVYGKELTKELLKEIKQGDYLLGFQFLAQYGYQKKDTRSWSLSTLRIVQ